MQDLTILRSGANGYCVIDVGCSPGFPSHYGCSNMGISRGCYDLYGSGTTCNWIDITDVPAGMYTLVLRTNWARRPDALGRHEMNYANNYTSACINITGIRVERARSRWWAVAPRWWIAWGRRTAARCQIVQGRAMGA